MLVIISALDLYLFDISDRIILIANILVAVNFIFSFLLIIF